MHARDVYKAMLRDTITPGMRARGFRGGTGSYYVDGESGHTGSVLISGNSKRSTAEVTYFHIHFGVQSAYLKQWDAALGSKPKRASDWSDHDWFDDVPAPNNQLAGYVISVTSDPTVVGREIIEILDGTAIPAVRASLDDSGLRQAIDGSVLGVGGIPLLLMDLVQGRVDQARSQIAEIVDRNGKADPGSAFLLERLADAEIGRSPAP